MTASLQPLTANRLRLSTAHARRYCYEATYGFFGVGWEAGVGVRVRGGGGVEVGGVEGGGGGQVGGGSW